MSESSRKRMCRNILNRIDDLEQEISLRLPQMCEIEAKIFYDDLLTVHKDMVSMEKLIIETSIAYIDTYTSNELLQKIRQAYLKVTNLKVKFEKKKNSSNANSAPPTNLKVNNQSNLTKQPETVSVKNLYSQIRKQSFLIKRIESLEIHDDRDICAAKAEIMNYHISELYDSFISNQIQIEEASLDDAATLNNQQKIATDIQRKVIDFQTKLKKIMRPGASTEYYNNDHSLQSAQADTKVKLDSLFAKQLVLLGRIQSLRPEIYKDVSPEKAEILYNRLTKVGELFDLNQIEIELRVDGIRYESNRKVAEEMQKNVIEYQETYKKIFAPIKFPSSTQPEKQTLASERIKSSVLINDRQHFERRKQLFKNPPTEKEVIEAINRAVLSITPKDEMKKSVDSTTAVQMEESTLDIDLSSQSTPTDTGSTLEFLYKKTELFIEAIFSMEEPKEDVGPEKAEIMYNHLNSLYESFNSNQNEIEARASGVTLENKFVNRLIRNRVIGLQTTLKKIMTNKPVPESSKQLEKQKPPTDEKKSSELDSEIRTIEQTLSNLKNLCNELMESRSERDETRNNISNIVTSLSSHVEISKDIQTKVLFLQKTLDEFITYG